MAIIHCTMMSGIRTPKDMPAKSIINFIQRSVVIIGHYTRADIGFEFLSSTKAYNVQLALLCNSLLCDSQSCKMLKSDGQKIAFVPDQV